MERLKVSADAIVQNIEWTITFPKGAKGPRGTISLTETGWGRSEDQGEGLKTVTCSQNKP